MGKRGRRSTPATERFWAKVAKSDDSESCWIWSPGVCGSGYGIFRVDNSKVINAHLYSYRLAHGDVPKGLVVRHRCNNPACVRPDHLILGTHKDNSQDAVKAGAYHKPHLGRAKAKEIAQLIATGASMSKTSRDFGVSYNAIRQIRDGISYRKEMQEALAELTQNKIASPPAKVELATP